MGTLNLLKIVLFSRYRIKDAIEQVFSFLAVVTLKSSQFIVPFQ